MAFLSFLSFSRIALPLSSAFVISPRHVASFQPSSCSRLFASTLELSSPLTSSIATREEEEAMFSDFPSLDDLELSPVMESKKAPQKTRHSIQVTEMMNASLNTSNRSFIQQQPSSVDTLSSQDEVGRKGQSSSLVNNPRKRLLQETVGSQRRVTAKVRETGYDSMKNYLKTMCNHELLNKNEEIILAREIQILMTYETFREELEAQLLRYV